MTDDQPLDLIATCAFGLEAVVSRELEALGYASRVTQTGRLLFQGDYDAICRANLHLRTAERILIHMGSIPAGDFDQLFDGVQAMAWEQWVPPDGSFPVKGRTYRSQLTSLPAIQRAVKKAVANRLTRAHGSLPESGAKYGLEVAIRDDVATLTIDTTGDGLHKRGYRKLTGQAPLRETLAAALVTLSFWRSDRPMIDPFCGTGTIPIEAAMIGRRIAPGLKRSFVAETWPQFSVERPDLWNEQRAAAQTLVLDALPERIVATDISPEALSMARYHAAQAGVENDIHWQPRDFADLTSKRQYGCVITNPPYGQRIGEEQEVEALLSTFPLVLRRLPTWSHFIISPHPRFEQVMGQRADRRRKLYNGRIECQYYQYHGPRPPRATEHRTGVAANEIAAIDAPAQSHETPDGSVVDSPLMLPADSAAVESTPTERGWDDAEHIADEAPADDGLTTLAPSIDDRPGFQHQAANEPTEQTTHNGGPSTDGERDDRRPSRSDGGQHRRSPTTERVFGGLDDAAERQATEFRNRLAKRVRHLRRWPSRGVTCYRLYERDVPEVPLAVDRYEDHLYIAEFDRPHERTPAGHADWLDLMVRTAADVVDVPLSHVHMKRRQRQRRDAQYEKLDHAGERIIVNEGGLKFLVNLNDYLDTGLFLDHRETRQIVRQASGGKRFLNLFAYTGAFTVYAAAGGAASTVTVDLSRNYLNWADDNLNLNGFTGNEHQLIRADILPYVKALPAESVFDVIVADPPTYSNSKSTEQDWDVQRDYVTLLNELAPHLSSDGVLFFSSNFRRFKFDEAAVTLTAREISKHTVPEDFRNRRIHRCWKLQHA